MKKGTKLLLVFLSPIFALILMGLGLIVVMSIEPYEPTVQIILLVVTTIIVCGFYIYTYYDIIKNPEQR